MSTILFNLNEAPYGNEQAYIALRRADTLSARSGASVNVFRLADPVGCANPYQPFPDDFYSRPSLRKKIVCAGEVALCDRCLDGCGVVDSYLIARTRHSTHARLADWSPRADKDLAFRESPYFSSRSQRKRHFSLFPSLPDLPGRERKMAALRYSSANEELLTLAADPEIFTRHQVPSAFPTGLSSKPSSTNGFGRHWNRSRSLDVEASIDAVIARVPPWPASIDRILAATAGA